MATLLDNLLGKSIDNLKSSIITHGGVAHENRFSVNFAPPDQTLFNIDLRNIITSALSGTFNLKNLYNNPRDITILCESCSLPGRQIMTLDYQLEKHAVKRPYSFFNDEVNFTFLMTNDYYMKKIFDKWSEQIMGFSNYRLNYLKDFAVPVTISQLNKKNLPIYTVVLHNAFPVTFNSIALDNTAENSVQKFSVTMAYENFFVDSVPAESVPAETDTQKTQPPLTRKTSIRLGQMTALPGTTLGAITGPGQSFGSSKTYPSENLNLRPGDKLGPLRP